MKVNVGCGNHYAEGWVNVDVDFGSEVRPDVVGDVTQGLPFADGEAEQIYLGHVLEHIELPAVSAALGECARLLAEDGVLCVVGPECNIADGMLARAEISFTEHDLIVRGAGRWTHDTHQWRSTADNVERFLTGAGFTPAAVPHLEDLRPHWPLTSGVGWQLAFTATKTSPETPQEQPE